VKAKSAFSQAPAAERPVQYLPGVGPKLAELLAQKLNLHTCGDLWFHLPIHYEDRTRVTPIGALRPGLNCLVEGVIELAEISFRGRRSLVAVLADDTGRMRLRYLYFQNAQLEKFKGRPRLRAFGEVRGGASGGALGYEMIHPKVSFLITEELAPIAEVLTPVYPKADGITSERILAAVQAALKELPKDLAGAEQLELIPASVLRTLKWSALGPALQYVHTPPPNADTAALEAFRHPAQRRLAGEELLAHQLSQQLKRQEYLQLRAPILACDSDLQTRFLAALPFHATGAQMRVAAEIATDLAKAQPMLRLVQGDVGCGKTLVAAMAALRAIAAGYQVALIAPTELLAEQHLRNFQRWFTPLGIAVAWLAGKVKGRARESVLAHIREGSSPMVIGTHALIGDAVQFHRLALCVIDEQHRFGVHQRLQLRNKGASADQVPHQLVMTATPIPRTLAMASFADLDISVIDQLPPGRIPVQTVVVNGERRPELIARIQLACEQGKQAYWVCTIIDESDLLSAQAAAEAAEMLTLALPGLRVGLVHGRLKAAEKDAVMQAFAAHALDVLVATTVIEVGVDVPNASLMLIENAERLGLSQLHQLRGRVGRGSIASSCVLMYQGPLSQAAKARLNIMRESNDGFVIAEKDLELRGPGELLGTKQTGDARFRIADLARDGDLLESVQAVSASLLQSHPEQAQALVKRWIGAATAYAQA
jgi:ATP-dependent DNA helicase RecG